MRTLPEGVTSALADLVRAMNEDFSENPKQRDQQMEAKAHVDVQAWIVY